MRKEFQTLLAALLMLMPSAANLHAQSPAGEFDQWLGAISAAFSHDAGAALQPGDAIAYRIATCVDGKIETWSVSLDPASGKPRISDSGIRVPVDCTPGLDTAGSPIGGPGILVRARTPGRALRPLFRRLPFWPLYPASSFPDSAPACDPENSSSFLVANYATSMVTRVMTCSGKLAASIPVAPHPLQIATVPDSSLALVSSSDNAVTFIDTATDTVVFTLRTPTDVNPSGIAISPDGATAYVTSINVANPALVFIDIPGRRITRTISLAAFPQSVFLSPDGTLAWVTHPVGDLIEIIDTMTGNVNQRRAIRSPYGIAFNSTGSKAYVASAGDGLVTWENTTYSTLSTAPTLAGGETPVDILVTPDDGLIIVANYRDKSISLIHPSSFAVSTIPVGGSPRGLALVQ